MVEKCLVLASRQALERIEHAVDQALEALDLVRIRPTPASEAHRAITEADVVLAEVSRPSTAVSFELGLASAQGTPIAYFASSGARVSPVFSPVVLYDADWSIARLAYLFARGIDRVRATGAQEDPNIDQFVSNERGELATPWNTSYELGERFESPVVHVDEPGGFVLVAAHGRTPAILHVRNMSVELKRAFDGGAIHPGDYVFVEVMDVDERRQQVQLRDVLSTDSHRARPDSEIDLIARLYKAWAAIEPFIQAVESGDSVVPTEANVTPAVVARWFNLYRPEIREVRDVRNRLTHGQTVSSDALRTAVEYAEEMQKVLGDPPRKWWDQSDT
jgi:hypothetical protein